jgi:hypothetical protein
MTITTNTAQNVLNLGEHHITDDRGILDMPGLIAAYALNGDFTAYTAANVTDKAKVRATLKAGLSDAIGAMNLDAAKRYNDASNGVLGAKAAKAATPVNQTDVIAKRAYMLVRAGMTLLGGVTPNGLNPENSDMSEIKAAFDAYMDGTLILDEKDEEGVLDIATAKVTKSAERVDIAAHVAEVIQDIPNGTFVSVRTIASTSTQAAPNGCPSDGAVAMRLFPQKGAKCTLPDVEPASPESHGSDVAPVKGLIVRR